MDWTTEDHLRNKPAAAVAMYNRFIELVERCGPFTYGHFVAAPYADRRTQHFEARAT